MKKNIITTLIILLVGGNMFAQFNYVETLQKYWNYRYHLLGDQIIKDQYMPWVSDYRYKLGEPGMVVSGNEVGNSIPATGISLLPLLVISPTTTAQNFIRGGGKTNNGIKKFISQFFVSP